MIPFEISRVAFPPATSFDPETWPMCPWCRSNIVGLEVEFDHVAACPDCHSEFRLTHDTNLCPVYQGLPTEADKAYSDWWLETHRSPISSPKEAANG